jgi:ribosomal protein S18 acetylase RimI-like enzyme
MAVQRVCDSRVPYRAASRIRIALKRVRVARTACIGLNELDFCAMADETAESLREMAQHRGLKLVKSRRRKPGTGDFGKFGLTDEKGKPLLGVGDDGLTASAADIEQYLRAGAASTWQQSAKITPDRPASRGERKRGEVVTEEAPPRRSARGQTGGGGGAKRSKPSAAAGDRETASRGKADPDKAASKLLVKSAAKPEPVEVAQTLVLRSAKPADAGAIAKLLGQLSGIAVSEDTVARDFAALRRAGGGVQIAELGPMVGCIGWSVVPTLQRGPVGRITVLVVDEDYRRQGIGTQLLAEAEAALAKKGCALIEAMSDIEIKNSHNFFRAAKFDQTSYRFARKIAG